MIHNIAIRTKATTPTECILGCCYPLSKQTFFDAYQLKSSAGFLGSQLQQYTNMTKEAIWDDIYSRFAETMNEGLDFVEKLGVRVIRDFTFSNLNEINKFSVFTLFTHSSKSTGEVEFSDGLYSKESFAQAFSLDFKGILDLTVCDSTFLRDEVKKRLNQGQVISFRVSVPIIALMLLYRQVILNLSRVEINYIDCYIKTLEHLNKKK